MLVAHRRIKLPEGTKKLYEKTKVSASHVELMAFSAFIGFHFKKKRDVGKSEDNTFINYFNSIPNFELLLFSIAVYEERNVDILKDERSDDLITHFEKYAAGGLEYIENMIVNKGGEQIYNFIDLINDVSSESVIENENEISDYFKELF
jgi:dnd system-associated protein 4